MSWDQLHARHQERIRAKLGPFGYRVYLARRWRFHTWIRLRRAAHYGLTIAVWTLQKLCRHDNDHIIRYLRDDADRIGFMSVCEHCGKIDDVNDELSELWGGRATR
jgi:hypothetical protein